MNSPTNHTITSHGPTGARARRCVVAAALALGALVMPATVMAERARLIRRFERGSGSGGSGLGLAIAHQVAVAHGGGVEIAASPSGGARVAIVLAGTPMPDAVA